MGREKALHAPEERVLAGHVPLVEEPPHGALVQPALQPRVQEQRLDLARERQLVAEVEVVQRLDAQLVAREEQALARVVPHRDRKNAIQALDERVAPRLVRVHQHFGVAARAEAVALLLQFRAEVEVVVDLAVERDPAGLVLVRDGLVAPSHVHDGQAAVAERGEVERFDPLVIGAAVLLDAAHLRDEGLVAAPRQAGDAAHRGAMRGAG
jgi:hypothetical protein